MKINVTIENATPEEIAMLFGSQNISTLAGANIAQVSQAAASTSTGSAKNTGKKNTSKKNTESAAEQTEITAAEPEVQKEVSKHTFDELKTLLTQKAQAGADIQGFLKTMNAPKLSAIPEEKFDEAFEKASAL